MKKLTPRYSKYYITLPNIARIKRFPKMTAKTRSILWIVYVLFLNEASVVCASNEVSQYNNTNIKKYLIAYKLNFFCIFCYNLQPRKF
jgi:hypothetical protein